MDGGGEFETVDGMPVCYGGDLYDSDWEDPRDLAYAEYVDRYNFDAPEGFELTALTLPSAWQFRTADIFSGSHARPVRPTICPRKATSVCINVHYFAFS